MKSLSIKEKYMELTYFNKNRLCSKIFKEEKDALRFIIRRNITIFKFKGWWNIYC